MSFFTPQFQIVSDLHLETPLTKPQYASFRLHAEADNLFLLGDIGLVVDAGLFQFLRRILEQNRGCHIFYVLGNHEPYQTTYEHACKLLRNFEQEAENDFGSRFRFLCRDRYNLNETITILGCTLWSAVQHKQESDIASRSTDLNSERGIQNWTLERHREEHEEDLAWLNSQVSSIERDESHRQIIIATHYSPTTDPRASDPRHGGSSVSSSFVTDLSQESCWLSPAVKLWTFGHTHYNCSFREEKTGKLVVTNQRGYAGLGAGKKQVAIKAKVVKAGKERWEVVERSRSER
jgi:predicted phosphodiesterase